MLTFKHLMEEFENIAKYQPVFSGDVISHPTVRRLSLLGFVTKDISGDYILTDKGHDLWKNVKVLSFQNFKGSVHASWAYLDESEEENDSDEVMSKDVKSDYCLECGDLCECKEEVCGRFTTIYNICTSCGGEFELDHYETYPEEEEEEEND